MILRVRLAINVLWNRSCFAGTCGGAPLDVIKQYISNRRGRIKRSRLRNLPLLRRRREPPFLKIWGHYYVSFCYENGKD